MKQDLRPTFERTTLSFRSKPRGRMRALIALTLLLAATVLGTLAWIRSNQPIDPSPAVASKSSTDPRQEPKTVTEPVTLPGKAPAPAQ
jgi:hypothetical protein